MIPLLIFPLLLAVAPFVSGCALTTANVTLQYQEMPTSHSLPYGTQLQIPVVVQLFADERPQKALGTKKNGYGMETAGVVSDDDLAKLLTDSIKKELARSRYRVLESHPDAITIEGKINRFWVAPEIGFFSHTVEGQSEVSLQLKESPNARPSWSNIYTVYNVSDDLMAVLDSDFQERVDVTFRDIVQKIVTDQELHRALRKLQAIKGQQQSPGGYEG